MAETGSEAHQVLQAPAGALRVPDNGAGGNADIGKGSKDLGDT